MATKKSVVKKSATKKVVSKKAAIKKAAPKNASGKKSTPKAKKTLHDSIHIISNAQGKQMADAFMGNINNLNDIVFSAGIHFDISLFKQLVALPKATGIRIYNAVKTNTSNNLTTMYHTFVITAVDKDGKTIFLNNSNKKTNKVMKGLSATPSGGDGVGNMGTNCPAY